MSLKSCGPEGHINVDNTNFNGKIFGLVPLRLPFDG